MKLLMTCPLCFVESKTRESYDFSIKPHYRELLQLG